MILFLTASDDSSEVPTSFKCSFDEVSICGKQQENNLFEWAWRMRTQTDWNDVEEYTYGMIRQFVTIINFLHVGVLE